MTKISFLMAANNEEKIIGRALDNLTNIPYSNYEILIGLDNCTDNTEEIVKNYSKKNKKIKYFKLNSRQGKTEVINILVPKANGDIIIIHDADWKFNVLDKSYFNLLLSAFNDKKVGGIAESFPIQYPLSKNASILESGVMWYNLFWMEYLRNKGTKLDKNWIIADKNSHPLLVNILRNDLYTKSKTLGDDFERFINISEKGYKILTTSNPNIPRMVTLGEKYNFFQLIKQKERTAIARNQIKTIISKKKLMSLGLIFYIISNLNRLRFKELVGLKIVILAFIIGTIKSKFTNKSTREGWTMRLSR